MAMSDARYRQIRGGLSDIALRIYAVVPMQEFWDKAQVLRAMVKSGSHISPDVVAGCLDSLRRSGLIKENRDGFCRVPVKAPPVKGLASLKLVTETPPEEESTMGNIPTPKPAPVKIGSVETLGRLAQQLIVMAQRHRDEIEDLAHLLADAAIEIQGEMENNAAAAERFQQLQALMKGA